MYTSKENVKKLLASLEGEINEFKDKQYIDTFQLNAFKSYLQNLGRTKKFQEGAELSEIDIRMISIQATPIFTIFAHNITESNDMFGINDNQAQNDEYKQKMLVVADYLFLTTLDTLGCPDIPLFFGETFKNSVIERLKMLDNNQSLEDYSTIQTTTQFNLQRRKSAITVRNETASYFKHSKDDPISPMDLAKFTAEYQALKQRQNNHGAIWRFFHRKENTQRMELLTEMKAKLEEYINSSNINVDTDTPEMIAEHFEKTINEADLVKNLDDAEFARRNNCNVSEFKYRDNNVLSSNQKNSVKINSNDIDIINSGNVEDKIEDRQIQKDNSQIIH